MLQKLLQILLSYLSITSIVRNRSNARLSRKNFVFAHSQILRIVSFQPISRRMNQSQNIYFLISSVPRSSATQCRTASYSSVCWSFFAISSSRQNLNMRRNLLPRSLFARFDVNVTRDHFVSAVHFSFVGKNDLPATTRRINIHRFFERDFDIGRPDAIVAVCVLKGKN